MIGGLSARRPARGRLVGRKQFETGYETNWPGFCGGGAAYLWRLVSLDTRPDPRGLSLARSAAKPLVMWRVRISEGLSVTMDVAMGMSHVRSMSFAKSRS